MSSTIAETFKSAKRGNRLAFMPFVTAGDPDIGTTIDVVRALSEQGVDLIEVGFPYSDPIADGPVIQASYFRALGNGITIDRIFDAFAEVKDEVKPVRVSMASFSLMHRYGLEKFLRRASESGFSGCIIPDLPGDESAEVAERTREAGLDLIQLVSPLTPPARVERIVKSCSGFVYCISVAGTTGERDGLDPKLAGHLKTLREKTDVPLAVGFGISKPDQVAMLKGQADGVIVGSAIVRRFEKFDGGNRDVVLEEIADYAKSMVEACRDS
ncbi:tryptophan synthase subunit alpha [Stratiformator vulcanicus]|uniref:Tryptophan synthase alpha chain n=1 Tax=Stratiformator vulcanicus TaxID=2527980 RepID=A0A517R4A4_9PLAN|nr:tryptophan synthase subunit alpha [Stratiformator vulcanicus]QDT38680.1 Tryptophan synthase alpha chain [Stratiformator vulcanicus]